VIAPMVETTSSRP